VIKRKDGWGNEKRSCKKKNIWNEGIEITEWESSIK
jgi:hypothetical protein